MFVTSIIAKALLVLFSTNGFIRNLNNDALLEKERDERIVSVAASVTVYAGSLILFYFAGVFDMPIR